MSEDAKAGGIDVDIGVIGQFKLKLFVVILRMRDIPLAIRC